MASNLLKKAHFNGNLHLMLVDCGSPMRCSSVITLKMGCSTSLVKRKSIVADATSWPVPISTRLWKSIKQ